MKKLFFGTVVIVLTLCTHPAAAQESGLLHFMNTTTQSMRSNPANIPDTVQMFFGVPFFGNVNVNALSPLAWSDIFTKRHDSLFVMPGMANDLTKSSHVSAEFNYDILTFGKRIDTVHFITAGLAIKGYGNVSVPPDAVTLFVKGNDAFVSRPCQIDGSLMGQVYGELALGYGYRIDRNWQVGARAKLLVGFYNMHSQSLKATLTTDPDSYNLTAVSDIVLKTSQMSSRPFNNIGVGFDAGVHYKTPIEGLNVGVSLIDWGFISWNSNTKIRESVNTDKPFVFDGFKDINNIGNLMKNLVDTLKDQFKLEERDGESFNTKLKGRIFVSASYNFSKLDKVGMLFRTDVLQDVKQSVVTIMYNRLVGDWFSVSAGNHFYFGHSYFNPSVAMNFKLSTLQFYIAVENISAIYARDVRTISTQFGLNIVLY